MVSIVAPHTPVCPSLVRRQGPIPHSLQHIPAPPILHGTISSARLNAVPRPNSSARISISWAAGSAVLSSYERLPLAMDYSSSIESVLIGPIPGQGHKGRPVYPVAWVKLTLDLTASKTAVWRLKSFASFD